MTGMTLTMMRDGNDDNDDSDKNDNDDNDDIDDNDDNDALTTQTMTMIVTYACMHM